MIIVEDMNERLTIEYKIRIVKYIPIFVGS